MTQKKSSSSQGQNRPPAKNVHRRPPRQSQSGRTPSQQKGEPLENLIFLMIFLVGVPLILIILMVITPLGGSVRSALGYDLESDDNFIIYDAICYMERNNHPSINVTYWTADAAPIGYLYGKRWNQMLDVPSGGIYTAEIVLYQKDKCPDTIILGDISRDRRSEAIVEVNNS